MQFVNKEISFFFFHFRHNLKEKLQKMENEKRSADVNREVHL